MKLLTLMAATFMLFMLSTQHAWAKDRPCPLMVEFIDSYTPTEFTCSLENLKSNCLLHPNTQYREMACLMGIYNKNQQIFLEFLAGK